MKKEIDIYNYARIMKATVEMVRNAPISEANKNKIFEFRDYSSLNGLGVPRMIRFMGFLKDFAILLNADFDKATKEQIVKAVMAIHENERLSPWTKSTYKKMIKSFYKWLKHTDEFPIEVKWIKTSINRNEKKMPANGDLLTESEVKKLVDAAEHPRDKALASILYESGARIGEIASLQIENVAFDGYGAVLTVLGKTGSRPIRVISSVPYLVSWMQSHPLKEDRKAPLWVCIGNTNHNCLIRYAAIRKMLQMLFQKVGIKKRCNPHIFRHSRATFLADYLTEFQMNQFFGWIQGSDMPSTYVHMSGNKIDDSILALNGLHKEESHRESIMKPKLCQRCDTINSSDAKFCCKCAAIIDLKTAFELEEKHKKEAEMRKSSDETMNLLMKDKELFSMFAAKMKELGLSKIST